MSDLPGFLLARIAEDEELVTDGRLGEKVSYRGWHTVDCGVGIGYWAREECTCRYVDRVLAECEAKRRIVEYAIESDDAETQWGTGGQETGAASACADVLRLLALPYAEHPEYDPTWRP